MLRQMQFYGENFSHSDGLSRQSMEKALTLAALSKSEVPDTTAILESEGNLWQKRLPILPAFSLETAGISFSGQPLGHGSYENERIARQEILSERAN